MSLPIDPRLPVGNDVNVLKARLTDLFRSIGQRVNALKIGIPHIQDHCAAKCDGATDDTAEILKAAASGSKAYLIPPNTKFNRKTLLASLPTNVVLFDFSSINDFSSAGETNKHIGILSSDEAVSDTHWSIDSGHHPIIATNNFGTAGSSSATERKATWIWNVGQFELGSANARGFRGAALLQFTKEATSNYWVWGLRSVAPWVSIAGQYEYWATSQSISGAGVYRENNAQQYVSTGAGTTGATPPTHTSGTVSDGGVSWTWVDSGDRTVFGVRGEDGRWVLNSGDYTVTWRHKVAATDAAGTYIAELEATGVSKIAQLRLIPTNSSSVASAQPFLRAEDGAGLRIMNSSGSTDLATFSDADGLTMKEHGSLFVAGADGDTTPSVAGIGTLYLGNTGATSVTALDDGGAGQEVELVFLNGNTTLVHSSTLMLTGSVNVTPTTYSVIRFRKVPNAISDRWIEASRSIK